MQVFGGKFGNLQPEEDKPRSNFDSFWQSLLTVFQVRNILNSSNFNLNLTLDRFSPVRIGMLSCTMAFERMAV